MVDPSADPGHIVGDLVAQARHDVAAAMVDRRSEALPPRFVSGIGVLDFVEYASAQMRRGVLAALRPAAVVLGRAEGSTPMLGRDALADRGIDGFPCRHDRAPVFAGLRNLRPNLEHVSAGDIRRPALPVFSPVAVEPWSVTGLAFRDDRNASRHWPRVSYFNSSTMENACRPKHRDV